MCLAFLAALAAPGGLSAQTLSIEEYEPKSTLVVPGAPIPRAKYPFIDVHNHQGTDIRRRTPRSSSRDMDALNMRVMVNLSGGQGAELETGYRNLPGRYPKRFVVFANLDFTGIDAPGWGEKRRGAARGATFRHGAQGLKIFKNLGMTLKDTKGQRVHVDDPRARPGLRKMRGARHPGPHPHGRAAVLLRAAGQATTSAGSS